MALNLSPVLTTVGLVGGYAVARYSKKRALGGVVLAAAGGVAAREWHREGGGPVAVGMTAAYLGAFGAAHPLAKKVGAWPAVLGLATGVGVASAVVTRGRG
ncbi:MULTISPECIES: hypothetical protein [Streptomyces]|uniref:Integral membrane protein n=1 Tax=Streptomyces solicathayae TaxID=3081768 RepID=A0ABZ0LZC3_9ACTN|nr:hypothetical protein [Streptomyces sp. HUAS YS2]WOX24148.1 hypothetical protein R2D22_23310 [Streptomyces sp. HUAS YS2]